MTDDDKDAYASAARRYWSEEGWFATMCEGGGIANVMIIEAL